MATRNEPRRRRAVLTRRAWWLVAPALVGVQGVVGPAASATIAASAPCQVIGFSPTFETDHTALCAHQDWSNPGDATVTVGHSHLGPITTYVTTDSGRTWRRTAGSGLPGPSDKYLAPTLTQIVFSPTYSFDGAIYLWAAADNLWRSTDLGASWTALSIPGLFTGDPGVGHLTPLGTGPGETANAVGGGDPAVGALAYAFDGAVCLGRRVPMDAIVAWPVTAPASGSNCAVDTQFLAAPGWPDEPALLLSQFHDDSATTKSTTEVWTCNPALECGQRLARRIDSAPIQGWLSPRYSVDRTAYVAVYESYDRGELRLIRSSDAGTTWSRWPSVDNVLRGRKVRTLTLALAPDGKRLTLRVSGDVPRSLEAAHKGAPSGGDGERIFVSTDAGKRWSLVASAPAFNRSGTSRLPFNAPYGYHMDEGGIWQVGGRLFTLAEHDTKKGVDHAGVWCSVDGGIRWSPRCSR